MSTKTQERIALVLKRMAEQCAASEDDAEVYAQELAPVLDELHGNDFFGTEGQDDPRGDFREGDWSMDRVQGIDA